MKPGCFSWRLWACLPVVLATAAAADTGTADPGPPPAVRASCVVALDIPTQHERDGLQIDTVTALLTSSELVDPAAREALGLGPDRWPDVAQVELVPAGAKALKVIVTVLPTAESQPPPNAAKAMLDGLTGRAVKAIDALFRGQRSSAKQRAEGLRARDRELEKKGLALRDQMREAERRAYDLSRGALPAPAERRRLESDLAEKQARLETLRAHLEELPDEPAEEAGDIGAEYVRRLEKLAADLRAKVRAGIVETHQLLQAEAQLAEAPFRVDEWSRARDQSRYAKWVDQCIALEADIAGLKARLKLLPEPVTSEPADRADAEEPRRKLNLVESERATLQRSLQEAERELEKWTQSPRLIVLTGGGA